MTTPRMYFLGLPSLAPRGGLTRRLGELKPRRFFRRIVSYTGFYCFVLVLNFAYTNNTTRAGYFRANQYYASYPAKTELLTDTEKLYKPALGNCFEAEE